MWSSINMDMLWSSMDMMCGHVVKYQYGHDLVKYGHNVDQYSYDVVKYGHDVVKYQYGHDVVKYRYDQVSMWT